MNEQDKNKISSIFTKQKKFFSSRATRSLQFRIDMLEKLKAGIIKNHVKIYAALEKDLGKSQQEVDATEIAPTIHEIDFTLKNLEQWMQDEKVENDERLGHSECLIRREAYGVNYIIAPFNYPLFLSFSPLIGSIMGGNTAIIKPSENTPNIALVIEDIVKSSFNEEYIAVIQGAMEENALLLSLPFDFIFFTGSPHVGKIVMHAAADKLIPVVLELGGKSPAIVCEDADLDHTVEQLLLGKMVNCGQTCIAPDYIYAHKSVKACLTEKLVEKLKSTYSELGAIGKVVTEKQLDILLGYIEKSKGKLLCGGKSDKKNRYLTPAVLDDVTWTDSVMQQELFGPIFPVMSFETIEEVISNVNKHHPKPLALYVFTKDMAVANHVIDAIPAGDAEVNGTVAHALSPYLPFGGVGTSGIGHYHGKFSYETFTHAKSIRIVK